MDVTKMLAELRHEREYIEEAITTLERIAVGQGRKRGRPPAWMKDLPVNVGKKKRGRPRKAAAASASDGPEAGT